ncbi:MAG: protein kinase [Planctomycetaceae bacterium]|nr:protein kinase [Planctomycetaceae bacterium]
MSGEYTLESLKEQSSSGAVDVAVQCTADDGDTWVSLKTLIMQNAPNVASAGSPLATEASRTEAANAATAKGAAAKSAGNASAANASPTRAAATQAQAAQRSVAQAPVPVRTSATAERSGVVPGNSDSTTDGTSDQSQLGATRRLRRITTTGSNASAASPSTGAPAGGVSSAAVPAQRAVSGQAARPSGRIRGPEDLVGVTLAGDRYRVVGKLGNGSMAYVLRATDNRLNTDVVIKVPKPEKLTDNDIRERFRRESQLMVELSHPHVVKVLDVGEYQELPFVVMQLLSGGTLTDRINSATAENARLPPDSLKTWLREVARALDFCYRKGTVHRDVKPANILFDNDGNAYVSDFGLTKIMYGDHTSMDPSDTAAGVVLGTPNYIAPEVILGHKYDGRADQYSLGITAYHSLYGRPPMQGDSATATMINQTQKQLQLLSDFRSDVPKELALAVRRAIEKDPEKRFDTGEEFAEASLEGLRGSSASSSISVPAVPVPAAPVPPASAAVPAEPPVRTRNTSSQSSARRRRPPGQRPQAAPVAAADASDDNWLYDSPVPASIPPKKGQTRSAKNQKTQKKSRAAAGPETVILGQKVNPVLLLTAVAGVVVLILSVIVSKLTGGGEELSVVADVAAVPQPTTTVPDKIVPDKMTGSSIAADIKPETDSQKPGNGRKNGGGGGKGGGKKKDADGATVANRSGTTPQPPNGNAGSFSSGLPSKDSDADPPANSDVPDKSEVPVKTVSSSSKPETPPTDSQSLSDPRPANLDSSAAGIRLDIPISNPITTASKDQTLFVAGKKVYRREQRTVAAELDGNYPADAITMLSSDGRYFAACLKSPNQENADVAVWDTATGKKVALATGESGRYADIVLVSPNSLLMAGRFANEIQVWDCESGKRRKSLRIPDARFRPGSVAVSHDGQYVAVAADSGLAVLEVSGGKLIAVMHSPADKPRGIPAKPVSGRPDAAAAGPVLAGIRSLAFSPDNQELAALSTHPQPRVLCWNSRGEIVADGLLPLSSDDPADELTWFPDGKAWLVSGRVIERSTGRVLMAAVDNAGSVVEHARLLSDGELAGAFSAGDDHYHLKTFDWSAVSDSVSKTDAADAWLSPGSPVTIEVTAGDKRPALQNSLRKALTQRLQRDGLKTESDRTTVFRIRQADNDTLVIELTHGDRKDEILWRHELPGIAAVGDQWNKADEKTRQELTNTAESAVTALVTPWFIPRQPGLQLPVLP